MLKMEILVIPYSLFTFSICQGLLLKPATKAIKNILCDSTPSLKASPLLHHLDKTYSMRKAQIGSTEAARMAGMIAATKALLPSRLTVAISVVGSNGETPYNMP